VLDDLQAGEEHRQERSNQLLIGRNRTTSELPSRRPDSTKAVERCQAPDSGEVLPTSSGVLDGQQIQGGDR